MQAHSVKTWQDFAKLVGFALEQICEGLEEMYKDEEDEDFVHAIQNFAYAAAIEPTLKVIEKSETPQDAVAGWFEEVDKVFQEKGFPVRLIRASDLQSANDNKH